MIQQHAPLTLGSSVCILGYGREGRSVLRFLQERYPAIKIGIADANPLSDTPEEVTLHCGPHYLDALQHYDTIVRSPGIPLRLDKLVAAKNAGVQITSATNLFFQVAPGIRIAITGTKGKSTTSALLAHLLATRFSDVRLVGNIGNPALDSLAGANAQTVYVVECSSYQLEDYRQCADIAVLLNIVEEHLDYHGDFARYRSAKLQLVQHQASQGHLVINPQHIALEGVVGLSAAQIAAYGTIDDAVYCRDETVFLRDDSSQDAHTLLPFTLLPIKGPGNIQNVMAAVRCAILLGLGAEELKRALPSFVGLPHRLQHIACVRDIDFYDDSLSTIPAATINALEALGERVHTLIAGGHDRGLDFRTLGEALTQSSVHTLITFPTTGEKIWAACHSAGARHIRHFPIENMQQAVAMAMQHTPKQASCLLSPASSSLNLFRDYRDRGEQFAIALSDY